MSLNAGDTGLLVNGKAVKAVAPTAGDTGFLINGKVIKALPPTPGDKCLAYPDGKGGWLVFKSGINSTFKLLNYEYGYRGGTTGSIIELMMYAINKEIWDLPESGLDPLSDWAYPCKDGSIISIEGTNYTLTYLYGYGTYQGTSCNGQVFYYEIETELTLSGCHSPYFLEEGPWRVYKEGGNDELPISTGDYFYIEDEKMQASNIVKHPSREGIWDIYISNGGRALDGTTKVMHPQGSLISFPE